MGKLKEKGKGIMQKRSDKKIELATEVLGKRAIEIEKRSAAQK